MVEEKENEIIELRKNFDKHKFIQFKSWSFPFKIDPDFLTPSHLNLELLFKDIDPNYEVIRLFFKISGDPTVFESSLQSTSNLPILKVTIGNDRRSFIFDLSIRRDIVSKIHYEIYLIDEHNRKTTILRNAHGSNGIVSIGRSEKAKFSAVSDFNYGDINSNWTLMLEMTKSILI